MRLAFKCPRELCQHNFNNRKFAGIVAYHPIPLFHTPSGLILFAHVPKCAGTAVERYLEAAFGPLAFLDSRYNSLPARRRWTRTSPQHADAASLQRLFPPGFLHASFAVVRHPVPRMVSAFRFQRDIEGRIPPDTGFEDWLAGLAGNRRPWAFDNHVRPMADMVPDQATVFRLEQGWDPVIDWLQTLCAPGQTLPRDMPRHNVLDQRLAQSGRSAPAVCPGPRAIDLIARFYTADFHRFGYVPGEGWVP
jgi:hypothetical protein